MYSLGRVHLSQCNVCVGVSLNVSVSFLALCGLREKKVAFALDRPTHDL